MKNKKYLFLILLFTVVTVVAVLIGRSFALPFDSEINTVVITSNNIGNPGSWYTVKSAEWTGSGKAKVTFDVHSIVQTEERRYKDIILIMDVSSSMEGTKLNRTKSDATNLVGYTLSNSNNRMALITFSSSSRVISGFTNDMYQMLDYIYDLSTLDNTNYNSALLNVDEVMNGYVKEDDRDLVLLFLTDGYPNVDTPNEKATYQLLKEKYPYMSINGVQYEMGVNLIKEIIDISDNQWIADQNSLNNVLIDAALNPVEYDDFVLTDYINNEYFRINSVNDISVEKGEVTLEEENGVQKIVWRIPEGFKTGSNVVMTINLDLKSEYLNSSGFYPTNESESIYTKHQNGEEDTTDSTLTPVLKNGYNVIYNMNLPTGCSLQAIPNEEYFPYKNVSINSNSLSCYGYLFKGWEIDKNDKYDMTIINDDIFIMPSHDVHLIATWTSDSLSKSMDGTVHEKATLYKVLQNEANIGTYAKRYTGAHGDSYDKSGNQNIYYYYASNSTNANTILNNKNNVIFADHCWQMIRTTDTGGVKLIYNGEAVDDKCLKTRSNHVGYSSGSPQSIAGSYYYGTDYIYENNTFKLSGTVEMVEVTDANGAQTIPNLYGKYTCKQTTDIATCASLSMVEKYSVGSYAYLATIDANSHYSQYGRLPFNSQTSYSNYTGVSPSYIGYMYNKIYKNDTKLLEKKQTVYNYTTFNSLYYFADSYTTSGTSTVYYKLSNPYRISSTDEMESLVGKYTIRSTSPTYSSDQVYYIVGVEDNRMYYIIISRGNDLASSNFTYTFGSNYTTNNDGTYTVYNSNGTNTTTIDRIHWYNEDYTSYKSKYACVNSSDNTCSELLYIYQTSKTEITSLSTAKNYAYGKNFRYSCDANNQNCKYYLTDDIVNIWEMQISSNKTKLNNHHYTCLNSTGECESISYVYTLSSSSSLLRLSTITLSGGKSISDALDEMLKLDNDEYHVNTVNSTLKSGIDACYKKYIDGKYDRFLEDTVFCMNRNISNLGGWNPNGGSYSSNLSFSSGSQTTLDCSNVTDRYSTLNNKAKLTYKVGMITLPEERLLNNDALRTTGSTYHAYGFSYYITDSLRIYTIATNGKIDTDTSVTIGVRPVISLRPGVEYIRGNGSLSTPYVIDTE